MDDNQPPELTNCWIENKDFGRKEFFGKVLLYESRIYSNLKFKFYAEALTTYNILDLGVIMISRLAMLDKNDEPTIIYYLQMEDGTWRKSKPNKKYNCELEIDFESKKDAVIFAAEISIETEAGEVKRKLVKEVEKFRL